MRTNRLLLLLLVLTGFSCTTKEEGYVTENKVKQDTLVPIQVTVLNNLPESLQPKTVLLDKMPAPRVVHPNSRGVTKMLPVLQNEKGETILDAEGKPFIMGDGGKSNFTNLTTDNGLPLDAVYWSELDKFGNLWFATSGGGVTRYDGKSFTTFNTDHGLAHNTVYIITEDKTGNLWFGTGGGGVTRYDGKSFTTFNTDQGLASNAVQMITEDKAGNLWIGTADGGVSRYDGKSFTTFNTDHGLANNNVIYITEDKKGNLWFATQGGGVSRYDGKSFSTFTTDQGLAHNFVYVITEDKSGNLWFGTGGGGTGGGGVSRYDGKSFTTFTTDQGLAHNTVFIITEDKAGNLWFGTLGGGVSRYDGNSFATFTTAQGLSGKNVLSITEDKTGSLWFSTGGGGVSRYDGQSFTTFTTDQGLADNFVGSIIEDKIGDLWFGTGGGGVSRYEGESFSTFTTVQGLANNVVGGIVEDKNGNLWLGTGGGGVSRYDGKSFTTFTTAQGLAGNYVQGITEDKTGNLWLSTEGGVSRYDGKSFTTFTTAQGLAHNLVFDMTVDKSGNVWFGTGGGGVSRYDGKSFTTFTTAQGLAHNQVRMITEDKSGNLWFGTLEGLSVLPADEVRNLTENPSLSDVERKGNRKKPDIISSTLFKNFTIVDGIADNVVNQVIQMPDGKMAIGTNLGITLFNPSNDFTKLTDIEIYNTDTGHPVKDVNSMLVDSKGVLWIGTGSEKTALVRFDYAALPRNMEPPTLVIQAVKVKDEPVCWYNLLSTRQGKNESDSATALLQEFFAYGKSMSPSKMDSLEKSFAGLQFDGITKYYPLPENLVLPYEFNQISFEFAAIETGKPFLVNYQYMLEGYDKYWSPVTKHSNAGFGNMNEGTYTFKLKSQGASGVWTDPITYTFKVLPPWWRTWWAYLLYILSFVTAVYLVIRWRTNALHTEKELLEVKVSERTTELNNSIQDLKSTQAQLIESEKIASLGQLRLSELDTVKTRLYTNITHEFRTPLTVILGVAHQILDNPDDHPGKSLKMIIRSGQNLLTLVNQMLDLSKLESGKLSLQYHDGDVVSFLGYIVDSFHSLAENKGVQIHFISVAEQFNMDFDEVRLQQVVSNIISNAIKFTPKGGHVYISTDTKNDPFILKIKDTGIGIADADLPHIFDRFYQADDSHTRHGEGTGIGLALTNELVKLMNGTIAVRSRIGHGTEFEVTLPIRTNPNSNKKTNQTPSLSRDIGNGYPASVEAVLYPPLISALHTENSHPHVLIVDDNEDVLAFVVSCLENEFDVKIATNGQQGEDLAFEKTPDLIVMDVMMPFKDGFEVCKTLKNDERTSHIPIILLTAKGDLESRLEGLEHGADDYLTKPFNKKELLWRIRNLLDLRRQLQQYYLTSWEESLQRKPLPHPEDSKNNFESDSPKDTQTGNHHPSIPKASSLENAFVLKVRKIIEKHLEETDFDVEKLCLLVALSHSQVHRKLSALTGLSATHFIRYVRLVKAKELIIKSGFSIAAIAYDCGFNDPAYFSRIFKQEFGISPQVWREQNSD